MSALLWVSDCSEGGIGRGSGVSPPPNLEPSSLLHLPQSFTSPLIFMVVCVFLPPFLPFLHIFLSSYLPFIISSFHHIFCPSFPSFSLPFPFLSLRWKRQKAQCQSAPGCTIGGFTRLLHGGTSDDLMNEIPTFVADPLPDSVVEHSW